MNNDNSIGDVADTPSRVASLVHLTDGSGSASAVETTKKDFTEYAFNILNDLRDKGQLCDAIFVVDGESFPVHRNIMSASSAYFRALFISSKFFSREVRSVQPQEVQLQDVKPEILAHLIDFAYSRTVVLTEDNVQTIFQAADRFLMSNLSKACCEFLKTRLCAENCLGIAAFARDYFRPGLQKAASNFAYRHFGLVVEHSSEFLDLSAKELGRLISCDNLNVKTEETVFQAVCKWIDQEPDARKPHMAELLKEVRLGFLPPKYLVETIKVHDYVRDNDEAKAVVVEALKFVCNLDTKRPSVVDAATYLSTRPRLPHEILFVIGGWSGGSPTDIIETYDTRADQWLVCRPPFSESRAYHGCVTLGHVIYIVGGFNGVEYFNSCRKFDPIEMFWSEAPPMNSKRCYVSTACLHSKVYAMGGFDGQVRMNTVERFDPRTNQWSFVNPMVAQRSDAKASVLDDKIYICGGFNGQECLNTAEYYNPNVNQWTLITPMRNRRSGVGVIAYQGCVYALGGFNGITRMNTAERYSPETNTWTSISEMGCPRSNFALGVRWWMKCSSPSEASTG